MIPIYILSKGRHQEGAAKSIKLFHPDNIIIVVEPQEVQLYKTTYPDYQFLVLTNNNAGVTFARNYVKAFCKEHNIPQYWQLDDDISYLYTRSGTKLERADALEVLNKCTDILKEEGAAIGALDFRQFAWAASKPIAYNSYCCNVVYMDTELLKHIWYTENTKEDYDIIIAAISAKLKVARLTEYAYSTPAIGSNKGGLKEIFYDLNLDEKCVDGLIAKWGEEICQPMVRPNGRRDVKINWKNINKQKELTLF